MVPLLEVASYEFELCQAAQIQCMLYVPQPMYVPQCMCVPRFHTALFDAVCSTVYFAMHHPKHKPITPKPSTPFATHQTCLLTRQPSQRKSRRRTKARKKERGEQIGKTIRAKARPPAPGTTTTIHSRRSHRWLSKPVLWQRWQMQRQVISC